VHRSTLALLIVLALAACAQPTPYQPARDGYGFTQQRIEDNRYRIVFTGNSLTPLQVVEDYMLYRAAEITLQAGYDYFIIADKQTDKSTQYSATFSDPGFPYYGPYDRRRFPPYWSGPQFETGTYRPIESFSTSVNIVLYRGTKPKEKPEAYDARDVIARLGPTIRYPAPPNR
jgi:hypothetical protein